MKISNSKKQLAEIIHENGGWRDGYDFAAQDGDDYTIWFYDGRPVPGSGRWWKAYGRAHCAIEGVGKLPNWHQTVLSRDEYLHLYPAPDAGVRVEVENRTSCHLTVTEGPTIEQLAADYRAKLAIAQQAQEEADSHRCGAEAALEKLVAAGKAVGLVVGVAAPEPELVVTDWRDLQVGDVVEVTGSYNTGWVRLKGVESVVTSVGTCEDDVTFCPHNDDTGWVMSDNTEWRFIRRPTKEADNA